VLFEEVLTTSPWTLPSHASLLSGRYPSRHGLRSGDHMLPLNVPTLGASLARQGFETAAVVNNPFLGSEFGLDRGFQHHVLVPVDHSSRGAAGRVSRYAMEWLAPRRGKRVFLFLHYSDVHSDYRSAPDYERLFVQRGSDLEGRTQGLAQIKRGEIEITPEQAEQLARLYDAGIRQLDDDLRRLQDWLGDEGWLEDTLIVVTSDHGEEFLEHGSVTHGHTQYQELLRVPLLLGGPGLPPGLRVGEAVSLVDVAPTILGRLGVSKPRGMDGIDLEPLWTTPRAPSSGRTLFAEAPSGKGLHLRAAIRDRHKLVIDLETGQRELYDLTADPAELENREELEAETTQELLSELERHLERERKPRLRKPLTPEVLENLRALGYVL
jgi:arylsulfatase A-like enzyme